MYSRCLVPDCAVCPPVQGDELFDLSPAVSLQTQAVVLGDRRTFTVYDLLTPEPYGPTRSLNILLKWRQQVSGKDCALSSLNCIFRGVKE